MDDLNKLINELQKDSLPVEYQTKILDKKDLNSQFGILSSKTFSENLIEESVKLISKQHDLQIERRIGSFRITETFGVEYVRRMFEWLKLKVSYVEEFDDGIIQYTGRSSRFDILRLNQNVPLYEIYSKKTYLEGLSPCLNTERIAFSLNKVNEDA